MSRAAEYTFAIQDEKRTTFAVEFRPADPAAKNCFQSVWKRLAGAADEHHKADGTPTPDWSRWSPWDWCLSPKPDVAGRRMWVGWCGGRVVGFVSLWFGHASTHEPGATTVYVEHLGVFPGDLGTDLWGRRYRGGGQVLVAYAVYQSLETGHDGRLSLHASNADAAGFYESVNKKVGGRLFYPIRTGVGGPDRPGDAADGKKPYLETTVAGSREWLENYRHA